MPRTGRYFLSVAGPARTAPSSTAWTKDSKKSAGIVAYWVEGVRQLFGYSFPEIYVRSDGQERKATILIAGRTVNYGGPFKITTGANLFENSFEFLTNSRKSRLGYLACLPAIWMGTLRQMDGIETWKSTETIMEPAGSDPVFAQVDGEPVGQLPIAFKIVPDALSIIEPASR